MSAKHEVFFGDGDVRHLHIGQVQLQMLPVVAIIKGYIEPVLGACV